MPWVWHQKRNPQSQTNTQRHRKAKLRFSYTTPIAVDKPQKNRATKLKPKPRRGLKTVPTVCVTARAWETQNPCPTYFSEHPLSTEIGNDAHGPKPSPSHLAIFVFFQPSLLRKKHALHLPSHTSPRRRNTTKQTATATLTLPRVSGLRLAAATRAFECCLASKPSRRCLLGPRRRNAPRCETNLPFRVLSKTDRSSDFRETAHATPPR